MSASVNVQGYIDTIRSPWGQLFYRLAWRPIACAGKRVLDFGSGLGLTASHFAMENDVLAIEPNAEMLANRITEFPYRQIYGGVEALRDLPDQSFDVILCHNVLEYVPDRREIMREFSRLLKADGCLSIIKHHRMGKVMQKVVFENKIDEALKLLANEDVASVNFGVIREYEDAELETYSDGLLRIEKVLGLRMFFALQRNEFKTEPGWLERMTEIECAAQALPAFRDIAFFHHILLRRAEQRG